LFEAKQMLRDLQSSQDFQQLSFSTEFNQGKEKAESDKYKRLCDTLMDSLESININEISPMQSLQVLDDLQEKVKKIQKNLNNKK